MFCPDRRGHDRAADVAGPISHEATARDSVAFLQQVIGGPAALVGHSDAAPVALLTALARPDLVTALVFVSGVFHHDARARGALDPTKRRRTGSATSTPRCRRTRRAPSTRSSTACTARSRP